ncbi:MAG: PPOX class F420-dependent oxidoreductase [Actinomycetota bacterium]|nr:PPOX class F420-dependent oxidoreductase [Actinomycetota bacterium]
MDPKVEAFLNEHHDAVMTTTKRDGRPHVARISVGLVEGRLWSSGTQDRIRTKHLRRDPRCTLMVLDETNRYRWLALETTVDILDGPDAVDRNLALYRVLAGEPDDLQEYRDAMVRERRLIYQFNLDRSYGQF